MKRKTKKAIENEFNLFFETFIGEYVEIMTNTKTTETVQHEDGTVQSGEYAMIVNGYLLDEDENYYFLGRDSEEVTHCVKKDEVILVSISEPDMKELQVLENIGDLN